MKPYNSYSSRRKPIFNCDILYILFILELAVVFFAVSHSAFAHGFIQPEIRGHQSVDDLAPAPIGWWESANSVQEVSCGVLQTPPGTGDIYSCGIHDNNVVVCWGTNHVGQGARPASLL